MNFLQIYTALFTHTVNSAFGQNVQIEISMNEHPKHARKVLTQKQSRLSPPTGIEHSPTADVSNTNFVQRMATQQPLQPTDVSQLQRTVGNQAAMRMLADRNKPSGKMQVGPADDHHERIADNVAQRVSRQMSGASQASTNTIQRKPMPQAKPPMGPEGGMIDQSLSSQIQSGKQGGEAVSAEIQRAVSRETGADFSSVRVHTDQKAQQLNQSLGARAFTQGQHIFLGTHQSPHDVQLMAHELTHTVQQGAVPHNTKQTSTDVQRSSDKTGIIQRKLDADAVITNLEQNGIPNFTPQDGAATRYSITVAVAKGMDEHPLFSKVRMKSKIRNTLRSMVRGNPLGNALVRAPKTGKQIKEKAANRVIREQDKRAVANGGTVSTTPAATRANNIINSSDEVGHSWIKFNMLDDKSSILKTYSFGFIPDEHPDNPTEKVGGYVRNPDMEFEGSPNVRYATTTVSSKSFAKAIERAIQLQANPPQYSTMGYNCTKFTREIAKQGSASYPSGTGMIIPIHNIGGGLTFRDKSYMPGRLFDRMDGRNGVDDTSQERQMINSGKYQENDKGTLVSTEQLRQQQQQAEAQQRANMGPKEIASFLIDKSDIDLNDKEAWEDEGLTRKMLETLLTDKKQLWRVYDNKEGYGGRIEIGMLYQTFGFPIRGLPGTRDAQRPY